MTTGRNDPCPCGSGRKYKHCHLTAEVRPLPAWSIDDRQRALDRLIKFTSGAEWQAEVDEASEVFWPEPGEHVSDAELKAVVTAPGTKIAFWQYFTFDYELGSKQRTPSALFLEQHGDRLPPRERLFLQRMDASYVRLFEVRGVRPDEGLDLRDLITGNDLFVRDKSATSQLTRWELIAARVIEGPAGDHVFESIQCAFPPGMQDLLVKYIRKFRRELKRDGWPSDQQTLCRLLVPSINGIWMDQVAFPPRPRITTTDGNALSFTSVVFDVRSSPDLVARLEASPVIESDGHGQFVWLEGAKGASARLLGSFTLKDRRLTLDTMSEERAVRGRAFIEQLAGDLVTFRVSKAQDPWKAVDERREQRAARDASAGPRAGAAPPRRKASHSGISASEEARIIGEYYEKHYREWPDHPLPALNGRTPREAARLKTQRAKVVQLLKAMEHGSERQQAAGEPSYDFSWMWKELGVERE